jgi:RNA polymerase sigma factor (sigma-70 family)
MSNIKADPAYDPFPKSGLVKQYEPFIRAEVNKFCQQFPWKRYDDVLIEAVRLADQAAKRFNPELGYDFSTLLRHYLKKLYAMQEEETGWSHAKPDDWHQDQERSPDPIFPAGANGTRVAFDRRNWSGDDKRRGVVIGFRLRNNIEVNSMGFIDRLSAALGVLGYDGGPGADGRLKAAIDHFERVHREQEAEAEDRRFGIYEPTFLEARRVPLHLQRYEARTPRQSGLFPTKDNGREHWEEDWQQSLGTILYAKPSQTRLRSRGLSGNEIDDAEDQFERAGEALRPFLTPDERVVLDWIGDRMFGDGHKSADELADEIGRSRRTIYKIRDRVILKLKKERK